MKGGRVKKEKTKDRIVSAKTYRSKRIIEPQRAEKPCSSKVVPQYLDGYDDYDDRRDSMLMRRTTLFEALAGMHNPKDYEIEQIGEKAYRIKKKQKPTIVVTNTLATTAAAGSKTVFDTLEICKVCRHQRCISYAACKSKPFDVDWRHCKSAQNGTLCCFHVCGFLKGEGIYEAEAAKRAEASGIASVIRTNARTESARRLHGSYSIPNE